MKTKYFYIYLALFFATCMTSLGSLSPEQDCQANLKFYTQSCSADLARYRKIKTMLSEARVLNESGEIISIYPSSEHLAVIYQCHREIQQDIEHCEQYLDDDCADFDHVKKIKTLKTNIRNMLQELKRSGKIITKYFRNSTYDPSSA